MENIEWFWLEEFCMKEVDGRGGREVRVQGQVSFFISVYLCFDAEGLGGGER